MSIRNREQAGTRRPETWKGKKLAGETSTPPEGQRHEDYFPPKWYQRRGAKVAGVALGLLGAGAAVVGVTQGGEANPTPERSPSASATPNPGEKEVAEKPVEFGIPAAKFEKNPEALGREYYNQMNAYMIAGATQEAQNSDEYVTIDLHEYVDQLSAPIDQNYIGSLFIDEWQQNPQLSDYVVTLSDIAQRTRELRLLSWSGVENADLEPYARELVVESMEVTGEPVITTSTRWTERDNGPKTNVLDNLDGPDVNSFYGGETFVWVNVDGQMKIADISHYDG